MEARICSAANALLAYVEDDEDCYQIRQIAQRAIIDAPELVTDGGVDESLLEWALDCLHCEFQTTVEAVGNPRSGTPDQVLDRITAHKMVSGGGDDGVHMVGVSTRPVATDAPQPVADGGIELERPDTDVEHIRGATEQWFDFTTFHHYLLYGVAVVEQRSKNHGLAIKAVLEDWTGQEIRHGRLYPNLDQLVDRGLVRKGKLDKRTNSYELTYAGRELVNSHAAFLDQLGFDGEGV